MKIISALILIICFCFWTYKVKTNKVSNIDSKVYNSLKIKEPFITFYKIITIMGSAIFLIPTCTLIVLIFHNKTSIFIVGIMLIEWLLNYLLKIIIKRERPNIKRLVKEKGYSYPSGHTMSSTCFFGILIFLTIISSLLIYLKIFIIILLLLIIIIIYISRIYLGVHYFSDIIGGLLISLSLILLYVYFVYDMLSIM